MSFHWRIFYNEESTVKFGDHSVLYKYSILHGGAMFGGLRSHVQLSTFMGNRVDSIVEQQYMWNSLVSL